MDKGSDSDRDLLERVLLPVAHEEDARKQQKYMSCPLLNR